jgi:hypothetical protein
MQLGVTLINLQQQVQEITKMSLSTQRHGNLYKFKEVLQIHREVQGGMEIRIIDKGYVWQFASP